MLCFVGEMIHYALSNYNATLRYSGHKLFTMARTMTLNQSRASDSIHTAALQEMTMRLERTYRCRLISQILEVIGLRKGKLLP